MHPLDEALSPEVLKGLAVVNIALGVLKLLVHLRMEPALGLVLQRGEVEESTSRR